MRDINDAGLELIKKFEGIPDGDPSTVNIDPYLDPVGIWTIGWGHAISVGGSYLRGRENRKAAQDPYGRHHSRSDGTTAARRRAGHLQGREALVEVPLTGDQFGALVSFTFNLGRGNLAKSTLLRKLNDSDYDGAAAEFGKWNKAGGKVLAGLVARKAAEAELFQTA